jgi:thiamine biosynthesis lipoprotein
LLAAAGGGCIGTFRAMASPWEVHVAGASSDEVLRVSGVVAAEVRRIEHKYSRYRSDGLVHLLNNASGKSVGVDQETARLLDYAQQLWQASDGLFDITTGALRRVWTFDGSDRVPTAAAVDAVLPCVGWDKAEWSGGKLKLPAGMEVDFGGIGKEYAVDRALMQAQTLTGKPLLVNGGGDLAASAPPSADQPWRVGIDSGHGTAAPALKLQRGAAATSGDARRFLLKDGVRYSHVLDPRSGWPVQQAPHSVTVLAASCSEAGSHSTIAMLHGAGAEAYLKAAGVQYWVQRAQT